MHTDADIFDVWSSFVASAERLTAFKPTLSTDPSPAELQRAAEGAQLVRAGKDLVSDMTRARASMPKSTREWLERCDHYRQSFRREHPAEVNRGLQAHNAAYRPGELELSLARAGGATPPRS